MLRLDVSSGVVAAWKRQFVASFSVWAQLTGAIKNGAARSETMTGSMPGEISRSGCLILTHGADMRFHVRVQMPPEVYPLGKIYKYQAEGLTLDRAYSLKL